MTFLFIKSNLIDEGISIIKNFIKLKKDNIEAYLMLATLYEEKKDYAKGIEALEEARRYDEKNIDIFYQIGVLYEKSGNSDKAVEAMAQVLKIDPEHANALNYFIGYTWAEKGINLDRAAEMIKKALTKKPDDGYILDSMGWVYFKKGDYKKALEEIKKAHEKLPDDPTISDHLGDVYEKLNDMEKARHFYERAIKLEKDETKRKPMEQKLDRLKEKSR